MIPLFNFTVAMVVAHGGITSLTARIAQNVRPAESPLGRKLDLIGNDGGMRGKVSRIGCDCLDVDCYMGCCYCVLDCANIEGMDVGDKWSTGYFTNCTNLTLPFFGKERQIKVKEMNKAVKLERVFNPTMLCSQYKNFEKRVSRSFRFLCLRLERVAFLEEAFAEKPKTPLNGSDILELDGREFGWKTTNKKRLGNGSLAEDVRKDFRYVPSKGADSWFDEGSRVLTHTQSKQFNVTGPGSCTNFNAVPHSSQSGFFACTVTFREGLTCNEIRNALEEVTQFIVSSGLKNRTNGVNIVHDFSFQCIELTQRVVGLPSPAVKLLEILNPPEEEDNIGSFQDGSRVVENGTNYNFCANVSVGIRITSARFDSKLLNISLTRQNGSIVNGSGVEFEVAFETREAESLANAMITRFHQKMFLSPCPQDYCWRDIFVGMTLTQKLEQKSQLTYSEFGFSLEIYAIFTLIFLMLAFQGLFVFSY